jgi:hypothetical protein
MVFIDQMPVERIGEVGQHHRQQSERFDPALDRLDVTRSQHRRRKDVHLPAALSDPRRARGIGKQRVDDRFDREGETGFEAAGEVRGVHRDHRGRRELRMAAAEFAHQPLHVATLGFRETGGGNTDQRRRALFTEHAQTFDDVLVGTHDRRHLVHRRRLQRDRFAKVAHQKHLAKGRAALRSVQHRDRTAQAEKGEGGADRLAGLERIDRQRLGAAKDFSHGSLPRPPPSCRSPAASPTAKANGPCARPAIRSSARAGERVRACRCNRRSRIRVPD